MSSSLDETLGSLARAFAAAGVDWYLFGAQAALLRGSRRMTADVDVTIVSAVDVEQLLVALAREGLQPRFPLDREFIESARVLPLEHSSKMPVDVVLGGPGLDEYFLERSELVDAAGTTLHVPRREDLICMKLLAGRAWDMQDAEAMSRAGTVDFAQVESFIEQMTAALGDDELPARLEELRRRLSAGTA